MSVAIALCTRNLRVHDNPVLQRSPQLPANNQLNWQWVAGTGTGTDTRAHRILNPLRQAQRYDPNDDYIHRYLPELRGVAGPAGHQPGKLDPSGQARLNYPDPLVDLREATAHFHASRSRNESKP